MSTESIVLYVLGLVMTLRYVMLADDGELDVVGILVILLWPLYAVFVACYIVLHLVLGLDDI